MTYDIYVDGSFKDFGNEIGAFYSSAASIQKSGSKEPETLLTKVSNDEMISMRNVAGEILAVMMALEHCLNVLNLKKDDTAIIHYDYAGIRNWTISKGQPNYWKRNNSITQAYSAYINTIVRQRFNVVFVHTPAHSGIEGNELVDTLAKKAMSDHVNELLSGGNSLNE